MDPQVGTNRGAATGNLVGSSSKMARLRDEITRMARTGFIVLIEGESGSGKELVARRIHAESARSTGPGALLRAE